MKEMLEKFTNSAFTFFINLIIALIILAIGFKLIKWLTNHLKKNHKFSKLEPSVKGFTISFINIGLKLLLVTITLAIIGIPTATLVTVVGSGGVVIGLALQGGLSNIAGGLMLLIFKPFKVGDYILVNSLEGTVKSITLFYTTIVSVDNKIIQLPNGKLSNSDITNFTALDKRRVDLNISVAYDSDINKVKSVLHDIVMKHKLILKDEDIVIRLKEHGASSLNFVLRVWVKTEDYWNVYFDLMEDIKEEFDKNKIEIPYPKLDVNLNK